MPDSVSEERRKLVEHYGAEVILVPDKGNIGLCIEECLMTALKMKDEDPSVFVPSSSKILLTQRFSVRLQVKRYLLRWANLYTAFVAV
jgi:cysteine synthase